MIFLHFEFICSQAPDGYHSVRGVARTDSVPSDFINNEFVVYDLSQVKMEYLIEFQLLSWFIDQCAVSFVFEAIANICALTVFQQQKKNVLTARVFPWPKRVEIILSWDRLHLNIVKRSLIRTFRGSKVSLVKWPQTRRIFNRYMSAQSVWYRMWRSYWFPLLRYQLLLCVCVLCAVALIFRSQMLTICVTASKGYTYSCISSLPTTSHLLARDCRSYA